MASYNQQNQRVNTQVNINLEGSQSPDPDILFNQGIQLLEAKSYQQSINLFKDAIKADSSVSDVYYYLALALLGGRRPKILKRSEVEEIDQLLTTATAMGESDATVQWFQALVRDDYYGGNRMKCPSPSVANIVESIYPGATNIDRLRALLAKLPMTDNQLYIELVRQIS
jgi:tetratricopeptide (TPR) repeat protein